MQTSLLRLFIAGSVGFALMGALPSLYGLALPGWTARFGGGGGAFVLGLHGLGAFAAVVAGLLGIGGLTIRVALLLLGAGSAGLGLGGSWPAVLAAAALTGTGFGLLAVIVNRRFLTEFGARGAGMVGLVNAIWGLGAIAAPQAFVLAGERTGPVHLVLALLFALTVPLAQPSGRQPASTGLPWLPPGRLAILGFVFAAITLEVGMFGYGPSALLALGLPTAEVATLISGFFTTFLAARLALYWASRRIAPEHLFLLGFLGIAVAMGIASLGAPAAGFVLAGAAVGLQFPSFYVWSTRVFGTDPRHAALPMIGSLAGGTIGPLILGPTLAAAGAAALFPVACGLAALAGAALVLSLPRIARVAAA